MRRIYAPAHRPDRPARHPARDERDVELALKLDLDPDDVVLLRAGRGEQRLRDPDRARVDVRDGERACAAVVLAVALDRDAVGLGGVPREERGERRLRCGLGRGHCVLRSGDYFLLVVHRARWRAGCDVPEGRVIRRIGARQSSNVRRSATLRSAQAF
jgi:hypothetical protein